MRNAAGDLAMKNGRGHIATPSNTPTSSSILLDCSKNESAVTGSVSYNRYGFITASMRSGNLAVLAAIFPL